MQNLITYISRRSILMLVMVAVMSLALVCSGCGDTNEGEQLVMADVTWDSIKVHNRVAGFIIENGYGYPEPEYLFCETLPALQGLSNGDIDIYMEVWADNFADAWAEALAAGTVKELGECFPDAPQGWYVPTYMIKGDAERGIDPMTPDLKSVSDLPQYWELFKDAEVPTKGRLHNSPPGWTCTEINEFKFKAYGLNDTFNLFSTGSDTALATSMVTAYNKGKPWVGYYWEPTWIMGKLDMTLLEEPEFDETLYNEEGSYACAFPAAKVLVGVNSEFYNNSPELVEFLSNYNTTLQQNNDCLAYMIDNDGEPQKAAVYFLKKYPEVWKSWVPEDVADKVSAALEEVE